MTRIFENAIKAAKPNGMDSSSIIPYSYDMSLEDLDGLFELASSKGATGIYQAISRAFMFGFVMGNRCTHRRKLKRL